MKTDAFKARTKAFALRVVRLVESLTKTRTADVIEQQLLRCGTSVGVNYRATCRAKSPADFIAKLKIVEEECDETMYWIEPLVESKQVKERLVADLLKEADEILSMVVASLKIARRRNNPQS